jgi:two-component system CheB/CheR fusion protein
MMMANARSTSHGPPAPPRLRIVVIDDEPDSVITLLALLRSEGYDAEGFATAKDALKRLKELNPDVVVCDIAMPLLNGWEVAREVRNAMGPLRPKLIALSGRYVQDDKVLAELTGFNHYLTKPCEPKALLALLSQVEPF